MPLDPTIAGGVISGAGAAFGGLANSLSTRSENKKSREFAREMYQRQYEDNLKFWQLQNEYNSPQNQVARFQAAGLNKNLIAGQGNPGNAGSVQTPDVQPAQFRSPEWGNALSAAGTTGINTIYDLEIKQAQAKKLEADTQVSQEDALLRKLQQFATIAGTDRTKAQTDWSKFQLGQEMRLADISADTKRELLRQLKVGIDLAINKDTREAALNASNVKEAAERMLSMRAQRGQTAAETARIRKAIDIMDKDGTLKDIEIALRRKGINPNDPTWVRMLSMFMDDVANNPERASNAGSNFIKFLTKMFF